jgi:hypothetical protein
MALSRRDFLGATALGTMATRGIGAPAPFPTRAFGKTGLRVPLLAFGSGSRFMLYEKDDDALAAWSNLDLPSGVDTCGARRPFP